jgi:hypothetical protein
MHSDRTTKMLLMSISVALWGLLLQGLFAPQPSEAQRNVVDVNIRSVGGRQVFGAAIPVETRR